MLPDHEIEIRVATTKPTGRLRPPAELFVYFEQARVEQLLALGYDYAHLERTGILLVVNKIACKYHQAERFGDILRLQHSHRAGRARARSITNIACSRERTVGEARYASVH